MGDGEVRMVPLTERLRGHVETMERDLRSRQNTIYADWLREIMALYDGGSPPSRLQLVPGPDPSSGAEPSCVGTTDAA